MSFGPFLISCWACVALLASLATPAPRTPLYRLDRLAWYARRVERAKHMIEARYAEPNRQLATLLGAEFASWERL